VRGGGEVRANWKGVLKIAELVCPVALFTAASEGDRLSFHTLNRRTGNRINRQFIDRETSEPVERENQVKGYDTGHEEFIILEPEEVAAAVPDSDKVLNVSAFIKMETVDPLYIDKPYYLAPADKASKDVFGLIRDGLEARNVAALARTVLFRRVRTLLVRAHGRGLIAATLNFDYEVRTADEAFSDVPAAKITDEMLELAKHIIATKSGNFEPEATNDRYEDALQQLVQAKLNGNPLPTPAQPERGNVIDLVAALRQSAALSGTKSAVQKTAGKTKKQAER
jgi:DNA end-binding protein Ku